MAATKKVRIIGDGNCAYNSFGFLLAYHYKAGNLSPLLSVPRFRRECSKLLNQVAVHSEGRFAPIKDKTRYTVKEVKAFLEKWVNAYTLQEGRQKDEIDWVALQEDFAIGGRTYITTVLTDDVYSHIADQAKQFLLNNLSNILEYSQPGEAVVVGDYFEDMSFVTDKIAELILDKPASQSAPERLRGSQANHVDADYNERLQVWMAQKRPLLEQWLNEEAFEQYLFDEQQGILMDGNHAGPLEFQLLPEMLGIPVSVKWPNRTAMVYQGLSDHVSEAEIEEDTLVFTTEKVPSHWNIYLPNNAKTTALLKGYSARLRAYADEITNQESDALLKWIIEEHKTYAAFLESSDNGDKLSKAQFLTNYGLSEADFTANRLPSEKQPAASSNSGAKVSGAASTSSSSVDEGKSTKEDSQQTTPKAQSSKRKATTTKKQPVKKAKQTKTGGDSKDDATPSITTPAPVTTPAPKKVQPARKAKTKDKVTGTDTPTVLPSKHAEATPANQALVPKQQKVVTRLADYLTVSTRRKGYFQLAAGLLFGVLGVTILVQPAFVPALLLQPLTIACCALAILSLGATMHGLYKKHIAKEDDKSNPSQYATMTAQERQANIVDKYLKQGCEKDWKQGHAETYHLGYEAQSSTVKWCFSYFKPSAYNEPYFSLGRAEADEGMKNRSKAILAKG